MRPRPRAGSEQSNGFQRPQSSTVTVRIPPASAARTSTSPGAVAVGVLHRVGHRLVGGQHHVLRLVTLEREAAEPGAESESQLEEPVLVCRRPPVEADRHVASRHTPVPDVDERDVVVGPPR